MLVVRYDFPAPGPPDIHRIGQSRCSHDLKIGSCRIQSPVPKTRLLDIDRNSSSGAMVGFSTDLILCMDFFPDSSRFSSIFTTRVSNLSERFFTASCVFIATERVRAPTMRASLSVNCLSLVNSRPMSLSLPNANPLRYYSCLSVCIRYGWCMTTPS